MKLRWLSFFLLFQTTSLLLFARGPNLKFSHLGTDEGLSQSTVLSILQDSRGFMWFGTRDGLNKYDGYSFTIYKYNFNNKFGLSNSAIRDVVEDAEGNLWIATWGGGLNKFDRDSESFIHYKHDPNNINSIASNFINTLLLDSQGNLWIGTDNWGLDMYDIKANKFTNHKHQKRNDQSLSDNAVKEIFEDSQHNLWVGTFNGGLNLYNRETKTFKRFQHDEMIENSISSNSVYRILEDFEGNLWIGTYGGGLNLFDWKTEGFKHFKNNPNNENSLCHNYIIALEIDEKGDLWIGTENEGLSIFNYKTGDFNNLRQKEFDNTSLSNSSINSLYNDDKGNMWIGTFSGGINLYNNDASKFTHYKHNPLSNSLSNDNVLCIYEDTKDNIWIGTDGGGLNLFNRKTGHFTHFKHSKNDKNSIGGNHILSVLEDSQGNFWIGTWGDGITVINREKNTYKHYKSDPKDTNSLSNNNAWAIYEDREKNIWVGTYGGGLNLFNPAKDNFVHYKYDINKSSGINNNNIHAIFEDSQGNLWIGTDGGGLNLLDKTSGRFIHFVQSEDKNSISNNSVGSCILEDRNGDLWISTDGGLNFFDRKNNQFKAYRTDDGLPTDVIFGLLDDDKGNLWISTNKGLSKFNYSDNTFKNFTIADGLQSNDFRSSAFCKSRSGALYFGGVNGFNEFFPEDIEDKNYTPSLVITDFKLFNKPVPIAKDKEDTSPLKKSITESDNIILSHKQTVISFEFASLNYTVSERKHYAYMLEGFDENWNYIGTKRTTTYTNINPGEYIFKVKGLDNQGNWSPETASLKLIITPPIWQTWWFKSLSGVFVIGVLITLYKIRMGVIQQQQEKLKKQVQERTEQLARLTNEERTARLEAEKARLDAEQANRAKSVFLATMSHEIRTPLNGVIGMSSLLKETPMSKIQQEYTEIIHNCGDNLLSVINDILDFSKIESGKMELEAYDFDLRKYIEEVLNMFGGKTAQTSLDLVYQIDYNVPSQIIGDPHRLRQVLINLVGNAIKFTTHGEIFIGVKLAKMKKQKVVLMFEVRDTGIGIPPDKIDKLFKAFSQVDSSTTRKYGGTGLGLVISHELIKLMGGKIDVQSEPGLGTTFTFTIKAGISKVSPKNYVHFNTAGLEGKRILIVDDNATNRNILQSQIEQWNFTPVVAESAHEALDILSQDADFDLIITDMQMPEMNGKQLAQKIKKSSPALPIILLSSIGDENRMHENGLFSAILTKPVGQESLFNCIIDAFKLQKGSARDNQKSVKQLLTPDFALQNPLNILVAEDNLINQKLTLHILSKLGYKADIVENGLKAVEAVRQGHYNLILMDIQMPEMDGLEATKEIKKRTKELVIIAMTANAMKEDKEMSLNAGMDDYISKPINLEELVDKLKTWSLKLHETEQNT